MWFVSTPKKALELAAPPPLRELPPVGRCTILRHLELNPDRQATLWVVGLEARPAIALPLTQMHPRLAVRPTTRREVLNGSVLARWVDNSSCADASRQFEPRPASSSYQDLLRLALIYATGGTYLDLDELPIAPLPAGTGGPGWVSDQLGDRVTPGINNAAFDFAPRHACLRAALEAAGVTLRTCRFRTTWGMFGPSMFAKLFDPGWPATPAGRGPPVPACSGVARLPAHVFSPVRWQRARSFYRFSTKFNATWLRDARVSGTRALHLYTSNLGVARDARKAAAFHQRLVQLGICPPGRSSPATSKDLPGHSTYSPDT